MTSFTTQDTFDRIAAIVAEKLSIDKDKINAQSTLTELGADSLDLVEIIMRLEEEFNIEINDADAEKMRSMQDVVNYIHEKRTK